MATESLQPIIVPDLQQRLVGWSLDDAQERIGFLRSFLQCYEPDADSAHALELLEHIAIKVRSAQTAFEALTGAPLAPAEGAR